MSRQTTVTSLLDRGQTKDVNEMKLPVLRFCGQETALIWVLWNTSIVDLKHIDNVTESLTLHANYVDKEADCELAQLLGHYSSLLLSTLLLRQLLGGNFPCCYGEPPRHRNNCTFLNVMFHMRPSSPWRHVVLRLRLEYWPRHDHDLPPLNIQNITYLSWLLYQII